MGADMDRVNLRPRSSTARTGVVEERIRTSNSINGRDKETVVADDLVGAVAEPTKLTLDQFAEAITASWQQAVHSIIRTGRLLIKAKKDHPGKFGKLFDADNPKKLPFGPRTAQRLMAIADHPILSDPTHVSHLPPSWGTLDRICQIPDPELKAMLADGTIHPDTQRKDVEEIIAQLREDKVQGLVDEMNKLVDVHAKGDCAKLARRFMDAEGRPALEALREAFTEFVEECGQAVAEQADRKEVFLRAREAELAAAGRYEETDEDEDETD
jgi:hypothetical protein